MGCQAGAATVQRELLEHWPAETYNAGCFNPNSFFDGTTTPSAHGKGEAIDIGIEVPWRGRGSVGQAIFLWLYANRGRLGIVQLIWDGQIWSATNQPGVIRPYTANLHRDHIHVQFTPQAARNGALHAAPFDGTTTPTQQEADEMASPEVQAQLNAIQLLATAAAQSALRAEAVALRNEQLLLKEVLPRSKRALMALTGKAGQVRQVKDQVEAHNNLVQLGLADINARLDELTR